MRLNIHGLTHVTHACLASLQALYGRRKIKDFRQGIKLTYVKVVANSKKLWPLRHMHTKSTFHASIKFQRNAICQATKRTLEWVKYNFKGYLNPRWRLAMIDLLYLFAYKPTSAISRDPKLFYISSC